MLLVAVPAALLAAVSLAAFAGRWVWWLDVAANFRAQYALGLLILGLVLVAGRWRRTGYVMLGVGLLNLIVVLPLYAGSPGPSDPNAPAIRVVNFNLLSSNENYGDITAYLMEVDADLVFLHEASRPWEVAIETAGLDYEIIQPRSEDLVFGTLILARDSIEAVSYGFAADQPRAVSLVYQPDGWPVAVDVLVIHPLGPDTAERAALRNAQLGFAAEWAADRQGAILVAGDLNATAWSWPFRELLRRGQLRNSQLGFGLQASFPTGAPGLLRVPIDHVLHSDALRVRDRRLGPSFGSDHFVLIVDLELVVD